MVVTLEVLVLLAVTSSTVISRRIDSKKRVEVESASMLWLVQFEEEMEWTQRSRMDVSLNMHE